MLITILHWLLKKASSALRGTFLNRSKWITKLHNRLFVLTSSSSTLRFRDFLLHVDPRDCVIAKKLSLYGEYEEYARYLLCSLCIPGTVVVDVGANVGLHTILLSQMSGDDGGVVAFEPDPDNYRLLQSNIMDNGLTNVITYPQALSNETGYALLYQSSDNRGGLSLRAENTDNGGEPLDPVKVETVVGDDLLSDLDRPISLIKIDVEGAEPLVIQGLKKTLKRNPTAKIFFEFWPRYVRGFDVDPIGFLEGLEKEGFGLSIVNTEAHTITELSAREIVKTGKESPNALNILAARQAPMPAETDLLAAEKRPLETAV